MIHDVFLEHVMAHAPGYDTLMSITDAPIMPTPGAVGDILQTIAKGRGINAVGVDIGGATTDVFSVFDGTFNRTVSANLGMSYSISNVCAEATMPKILRWVHLDMDERELRNRVKNKMIRPTTIPQSLEALIFEQAVAREALRLAYQQHKEFATTLKGVQQQRTVGDTFSQQAGGETIVDNMKLDLLVASGGVLSHAPRMHQTAMLLIDAFEPEGITELAKDSIFMMPHLGVLSSVHPQAAMEVFEKDCLVYLGTCVAPKGLGKPGKTCFSWSLDSGTKGSGSMAFGRSSADRTRPRRDRRDSKSEPARGFDVGAGPGKPLTQTIRGGTVGRHPRCPRTMLWHFPRNEARMSRGRLHERSMRSVSTVTSRSRRERRLMAKAYTPGLKVSSRTTHHAHRILPISGEPCGLQHGDRGRSRHRRRRNLHGR